MINLFQRNPRRYRTPGGDVYSLFEDMRKQSHLLIAGATGSGKSVALNGIICNILHRGPSEAAMILIDPKRVELVQYSKTPHCIRYASEQDEILSALRLALDITNERYSQMRRDGVREYRGGDVYVIIDELAALMTMQKKTVLPILQQLGQIARAAHVHMIACTQTVKAEVLPTQLTCNFDARFALRTATAQQSRMIVDRSGCETFPDPREEGRALGFYRRGANLDLYQVPRYTDDQYNQILNWWQSKQCIA